MAERIASDDSIFYVQNYDLNISKLLHRRVYMYEMNFCWIHFMEIEWRIDSVNNGRLSIGGPACTGC